LVLQVLVSPGVQLSALESSSSPDPQAVKKPRTTANAEANFAIFMIEL
jgi:hypothetical protein